MDFLPSIHFCKKLDLFTIILNEEALDEANQPDVREPEEWEAAHYRLLREGTPDCWFETEQEALDYMIDGQELY